LYSSTKVRREQLKKKKPGFRTLHSFWDLRFVMSIGPT
jgi:hypothetical protein